MQLPLSIMIQPINECRLELAVHALERISDARSRAMLSGKDVHCLWYFNRSPIRNSLETVRVLASEREQIESGRSKWRLTPEFWAGKHPGYAKGDETPAQVKLRSLLAGIKEESAFLERWEVSLNVDKIPRIEIYVTAASEEHFQALAKRSWSSAYTAFCEDAIKGNLIRCVWYGCSAWPETWLTALHGQRHNFYRGSESFLRLAVSRRILPTESQRVRSPPF